MGARAFFCMGRLVAVTLPNIPGKLVVLITNGPQVICLNVIAETRFLGLKTCLNYSPLLVLTAGVLSDMQSCIMFSALCPSLSWGRE